MSHPDDLDQLLTDWLADESPRDTSARLARAAISEAHRTRRLRPLPTFIASLKGDPMETTLRPRSAPWARPSLALPLLLLTVALAAGTAVVGSRLGLLEVLPQRPALLLASPPPAGGGLLAFDSGGDIIIAGADGAARLVVDASGREVAPAWAPDGRRIAFWSFANVTTATLIVRDLVTGENTPIASVTSPHLSDPGGGPAWSPDGTLVAWAAGDQQHATITIGRADGTGDPITAVGPAAGQYDPVFSPDGSRLTFAGWKVGGLIDRWVADVATDGTLTDPRLVSHDELVFPGSKDVNGWLGGASFGRATWSADSATILTFAGSRLTGGVLLLVAADGSSQVPIAVPGADIGPAVWSPDGTRMAYLRHQADGPEQGALLLAAADGSGAQDVTGIPMVNALPAWSPDGSLVAVRAALGEGVVVVATDGDQAAITVPATDAVGDPVFQPAPIDIPGIVAVTP